MPVIITTLCPHCSGLLQVTQVVEFYYTYKNGVWCKTDSNVVDTRYYCENDCVVDSVALPTIPEDAYVNS